MKSRYKILSVLALQCAAAVCQAQQIAVGALSYPTTKQQSRLLFNVTASPEHHVYVSQHPNRLVVEIKNARLGKALAQPVPSHPLFSKINALQNGSDLKILVDLKQVVNGKTFALVSNNANAHRFIVDLLKKPTIKVAQATSLTKAPEQPTAKPKSESVKAAAKPAVAHAIVIAVDAGHGGDDPGAHGPNGTEEKNVTFAIAQRLAALINKQQGMKAVMVRKGDYRVDLRKRMDIARQKKADLFVSIHADAFQDATVKGASVYTLSRDGASSEAARWLAQSENAADLVGGVSLKDKEDDLASVLLDLSQTATQDASVKVANSVLQQCRGIALLHQDTVQKAEFLVLKSPDVPSILVETAFISNPSEEQRLLSADYQAKIAQAIFQGVYHYFKQTAPVNSRMAAL